MHFASGVIIKSRKGEFLNNKANQQRSIYYISDNLERAGCSVDHAKYDADVLIVLTAVSSAQIYCTDWRRHRHAGPSTKPCRNGLT